MDKRLAPISLIAVSSLVVSCGSEPSPVVVQDLAGEWLWPQTRIESPSGSCVIPEHRIVFELHPSSSETLWGYAADIRDTNIQCNLPDFPAYHLTMGGSGGTDVRHASGSVRDNRLESISLDVTILLLGSQRVGTMYLAGQDLRFYGEGRIEGGLISGIALTPFQEVGYDLAGRFQLVRLSQ